MINQDIQFKNYKINIQGQFGTREYIIKNKSIIDLLHRKKDLNIQNGRFFELPFVYNSIGKSKDILDVGAGNFAFSKVLKELNYNVTCLDNYDSIWWEKLKPEDTNIALISSDCRNMYMVKSSTFDTVLLISVIEHIPSNLICYLKDGKLTIKEPALVKKENGEKQKCISEALRVLRTGGKIILTTDYYIDYSPGMNLSIYDLLGVKGLETRDIRDIANEVYIFDLPHHKGRVVHVGLILTKIGRIV